MPAKRILCCALVSSRMVIVSPSATATTCPVRVSANAADAKHAARDRSKIVRLMSSASAHERQSPGIQHLLRGQARSSPGGAGSDQLAGTVEGRTCRQRGG